MKRLMLFIEPSGGQLNIFTQFTLPRLGSFILAGLVNRRPAWKARVFVEGRQRFDLQSWLGQNGRPEVVGISTITATAKRGYALADECRARGIPVVLGGPHVTFLPEEALAHAGLVRLIEAMQRTWLLRKTRESDQPTAPATLTPKPDAAIPARAGAPVAEKFYKIAQRGDVMGAGRKPA